MADVLARQELVVAGQDEPAPAQAEGETRTAQTHGVTVRLSGEAEVGETSDFTGRFKGSMQHRLVVVRKLLLVDLGRCAPAECPAGSGVEGGDDGVELVPGPARQVGALGEVLP